MVEPLLLIETKYLTKKKKKVELNGLRPSVQIANAIGCLLAFSKKQVVTIAKTRVENY